MMQLKINVFDIKILLKTLKTKFTLGIIFKRILQCKPNSLCAGTIWPSTAECQLLKFWADYFLNFG